MKSYKEINDEIQAEESLKHKTLMKMQEQKAPSHVWQKTLLIATAAVLLFIILPIQMHLATDSGSNTANIVLDNYIVYDQYDKSFSGIDEEKGDAAIHTPPYPNADKTGSADEYIQKKALPKGFTLTFQQKDQDNTIYTYTKDQKHVMITLTNKETKLHNTKAYGEYQLQIMLMDDFFTATAVKKDLTITIEGTQVTKDEFYTFIQAILDKESD